MNTTQPLTATAAAIAYLAGLLSGRGIFGFDSATWTVILGGVFGLVTVIYSAVITRKSAMVSSVAAMPEVTQVTLDKSTPGAQALSEATPSNVVAK